MSPADVFVAVVFTLSVICVVLSLINRVLMGIPCFRKWLMAPYRPGDEDKHD